MSDSRKYLPLTDEFFRPNIDRNSNQLPQKQQADVTSQNMDILNRCFDDIEQFVNRLQRAAEAVKEHNPRSSQNGSDKQYQPPPAKDFVIVFQKFKLAINLLAKLKGHIQDPDAPELLHVILGPLHLVSEASRDSKTGSMELAQRVVTPLITLEAIKLLSVCLSNQEMRLWKSLGNAWNTPRDSWPNPVPAYVPIFSDGWSPPPQWLEEPRKDPTPAIHREPPSQPPLAMRPNSQQMRPTSQQIRSSSMPIDEQNHEAKVPPPPLVVDDVPVILPPLNQEAIQHKYLLFLNARGVTPFTVLRDKPAENDKELTVRKGEIVEVIENTRNWWKIKNSSGESGFVPSSILKQLVSSDSGEVWEDINNATDFFDKEISAAGNDPYSYDQYGYDLRPEHRQRTFVDDMNDEFKQKCIVGRSAAPVKKPPPTAPKPPSIQLTEHSTPPEINNWLNSKGFSYRVQQQFATHNGRQLFQMSKGTIEKICGNEEGSRLYSQILVQKNRSGYKTIRSQELLGILNARRLRSDTDEADAYLDDEYY